VTDVPLERELLYDLNDLAVGTFALAAVLADGAEEGRIGDRLSD